MTSRVAEKRSPMDSKKTLHRQGQDGKPETVSAGWRIPSAGPPGSSDAAHIGRPDQFVQLGLEAYLKPIRQQPLDNRALFHAKDR